MTEQDVYEKGYAAYVAGTPRHENPYKYRTWWYNAWRNGWLAASRHS